MSSEKSASKFNEPGFWTVVWVSTILSLAMVAMIFAMQMWIYQHDPLQDYYSDRASMLPADAGDLAAQRDALSRYRWVDQDKGVAGIPIEKAMHLVVNDS